MSLIDREAATQPQEPLTRADQERQAFENRAAIEQQQELDKIAKAKGQALAGSILELVYGVTKVGPRAEIFPFSVEGDEESYLSVLHGAMTNHVISETEVDILDLPDGRILEGPMNSLFRETVYTVERIDGEFKESDQVFGYNYMVLPNQASEIA